MAGAIPAIDHSVGDHREANLSAQDRAGFIPGAMNQAVTRLYVQETDEALAGANLICHGTRHCWALLAPLPGKPGNGGTGPGIGGSRAATFTASKVIDVLSNLIIDASAPLDARGSWSHCRS